MTGRPTAPGGGVNVTRQLLADLGHLSQDAYDLPTSDQRFEDGRS